MLKDTDSELYRATEKLVQENPEAQTQQVEQMATSGTIILRSVMMRPDLLLKLAATVQLSSLATTCQDRPSSCPPQILASSLESQHNKEQTGENKQGPGNNSEDPEEEKERAA